MSWPTHESGQPVTTAFFEPLAAGRYRPQEHVVGPWDPGHMHGGPPTALLVHEILRRVDPSSVPADPLVARVTIDFLAPVPVADVDIAVRVVRPGRRVALAEAELAVAGRRALLARVWLMRQQDISVPPTRREPPPPAAEFEVLTPPGWNPGYLQAVEWGWVEGRFERPGPSTAWARPRMPLVAGRELSGVERLLLVADSASGLSAVANPAELIFVNTDLSLHLWRPPTGDRVWLRAESFLGPSGTGLATATLGDPAGALGTGQQSLFLAPNGPPPRSPR